MTGTWSLKDFSSFIIKRKRRKEYQECWSDCVTRLECSIARSFYGVMYIKTASSPGKCNLSRNKGWNDGCVSGGIKWAYESDEAAFGCKRESDVNRDRMMMFHQGILNEYTKVMKLLFDAKVSQCTQIYFMKYDLKIFLCSF